jgi:Tfp pilus assembly protein PilO
MTTSPVFEALRRPVVWITIVITLVVVIAWYFVWMSPEGNKLNNENAQIAQLQSTLNAKKATLAQDQSNQQNLGVYTSLLQTFATAVPPAAEQQQLVTALANLGNTTGVQITSLTVPPTPTPVPGTLATAAALDSLSISITISGTWAQCMNFLQDVYSFPRLITIQSFQPTPVGGNPQNTTDIINPGSKAPYTFTMTGAAYFSPVVGGAAASSSTTTVP